MPKTKLSQASLRQFQCPPQKDSCIFWDETLPGFGLKVYSTGGRSFVLRSKNGLQFQETLGSTNLISLTQAREAARTILAGIRRRQSKEWSADDFVFMDLCDEYVLHLKQIGNAEQSQFEEFCDEYLVPLWGIRKIDKVSKADITFLLNLLARKDLQKANYLKKHISEMYEFASGSKLLAPDIVDPTIGIPNFDLPTVGKVETFSEKLLAALKDEPSYFAKAAICLMILTNLKKAECTSATWDQIDWEAGTITVCRKWNNQWHIVSLPLSSPAVDLLERIPKSSGNTHIFPGNEPGMPLFDLDDAYARLKRSVGLIHARCIRERLDVSDYGPGTFVFKILDLIGPHPPLVRLRDEY